MSIVVQLGDNVTVHGSEPITLVGANGAGKTRFGTHLVSAYGYDRVSAQRNLSLPSIAMQTHEEAVRQSEQNLQHWRQNTSDPTGDLHVIMAELKAADVQSASTYKARAIELGGNGGLPEETSLDVLRRLWGLVFPGRELDLSGYEPKARWTDQYRQTGYYSTASMSDGERSALYHIARLLRAKPGPVVIDEPEIHFHSLLARRFWDLVEAQRPDCRFIYITHDLGFALSRRGRVGIVKGPSEVELFPENSGIPNDLIESILGAASLSVVASRIAFCEGDHEKSVDVSVYGAWFRSPGTAVVPVGSCETVRRTFATFKSTSIIRNANPIALVERDFWPDLYLARLASEGLHVLPTHEVEGLLAIKQVAEAVAAQLSVSNFEAAYEEFERKVKAHFTGILFNKVVLERAKRDVDVRLLGLANAAAPHSDLGTTRTSFIQAVDIQRAVPDAGALFDEHANIASTALAGDLHDVLRVFPSKECLAILTQQFGVTKARYLELVMEGLAQPDTGGKEALESFRTALVSALAPHLPARS